MKIFVTGGAGFIGSNFIRHMKSKYPSYRITCIDSLTYAGNLENLEGVECEFARTDISDKDAIEPLFAREKPDAVINFAAESHVDRSLENPELFLRTNIIGTQTLMDACLRHGVKRYHQVSTDEVYGDLPLDRPELKFTEETPLKTSSPYSASKASADLLCMAYVRTFGLPATISRCSNNYGPYHFPEKLIPLAISRIEEDRTVPVYGTGENVRDWLYVTDHCTAIDRILHDGKTGEIYNIGGNSEKSNIEVVRTLLKICGKPESLITYVKDRPGHDLRYAIDASKINRELGWTPSLTFEEGIEKTVKWYRCNQKWWKNIINGEYRNYYKKHYGQRDVSPLP